MQECTYVFEREGFLAGGITARPYSTFSIVAPSWLQMDSDLVFVPVKAR